MEKAKTKMTLHRALSELKLIDSKISKQISEIVPVGIHQEGKLINANLKEEDFKTAAQSKFDSINTLIKRKSDIKSAIVEANANTTLTVGTKIMTIADAINLKASIAFKKAFIDRMKAVYNSALATKNKNNDTVNANVQVLLEKVFSKDTSKVAATDMANVRDPYLKANEFHMYDPIDCKAKIEALELEVSEFESEVDSCLSEINAITTIEI